MYTLLRSRFGPMLERINSTVEHCYMLGSYYSVDRFTNDVPIKPKKPLTGLQRYVLEVEPHLKLENPHFSNEELRHTAHDLWKELDPNVKLPYKLAARKENEEYMEAYKLYQCSLSDEQSAKIIMRMARSAQKKYQRELKDVLKEMGKPRKPIPVFMRFVTFLRAEKIPMPLGRQHFHDKAGEMWKNLDKEDKEKILAVHRRELEKYEIEKAEWEKKMSTGFEKWEDISDIAQSKKTMADFKKPVKPRTAFLLYVEEIRKYNEKVYIMEVSQKWAKMPQEKKEKYITEAQKLYDDYVIQLAKWNKKMDEYFGPWAKKIPTKRK